MERSHALLLADVVDSTALNQRVGDAAMASIWEAHDRSARALIREWRGREVGRSDGFLLLFGGVEAAVRFALAYQGMLGALPVPLEARVGIHWGPVTLRENTARDRHQGATPFEVDGIALPVAARVMSACGARQILLSAAAAQVLEPRTFRLQSHGHWRLKGVAEPLELHEVGIEETPFRPPPDSAKAYRVVLVEGGWMPVVAMRHGLPSERDSFVGREGALAALAAGFDGEARLISVLGIGGIGKTRLALRYARQWLGDFPGGAWFCDLSSARTLDGIVHAVAQGLDVPLGNTEPSKQLGTAIANRGRCLVILDNFEQVARHAEATVGAWLERAPEARFLVTSREVLGIPGEELFVVAPLGTDDAVRLFEWRARAAGASASDVAERSTIATLVELLDRLPLAIELAAARIRVLGPRAMLVRMGERFKLLASSGGRRDRQATLRAALDWSWDLLAPQEQSALAQLAVFEGGFTIEAAEAVVVLEPPGSFPILDIVQSLLQKSLLRTLSAERFGMLRSVQDYAAEHLAAGPDRELAAARHRVYFSGIEEPGSRGGRFEDVENLIKAFRGAVTALDRGAAVKLLASSATAMMMSGPASTVIELADLLPRGPDLSPLQRATVAVALGNALHMLGQTDRARIVLADGLAEAVAAGDVHLQARLRCALAEALMRSGQHAEALALVEQARADAERQADGRLSYTVLNRLGILLLDRGDNVGAAAHLRNALATARTLGHRRWECGSLGNLGLALHGLGEIQDAADCFRESVDIGQSVGDRQWTANARCNLAFLLYEEGRNEEASHEFERVLQEARDIGHRPLESTALCNLGLSLLAQSKDEEAARRFDEASRLAEAIDDRRLHVECRRHLAIALDRLGRAEEAAQAAAHAVRLAVDLRAEIEVVLSMCVQGEIDARAGRRDAAAAILARVMALSDGSASARASVVAEAVARLRGQIGEPVR